MQKPLSICVLTALAVVRLTAQLPVATSSGSPAGTAQTQQDPLGRTSPQSTMYGFLEACRKQDYVRAAHYLSLIHI